MLRKCWAAGRRRPVTVAQFVLAGMLHCLIELPGARAQTAAAQVDTYMQSWIGCSEQRLPSWSAIGACAVQRPPTLYDSRDGNSHILAGESCAAAFDGNSSTFVEDVVLRTDRKVFGAARPSLVGNTDGTHIGINLHGHLVHLTGVTIIPRPPNTDWQPRKHPYSPDIEPMNWTTAISGARVQGSRDLVNWHDLYTFHSVVAPHPAGRNTLTPAI
jgi:hypothetical protein